MQAVIFSDSPGSRDDEFGDAGPGSIRFSDVLRVTVSLDDGRALLELDGDVCGYTAPYLDWHFHQLRSQGVNRLGLDCAGLRCLTASGVDVIAIHAAACVSSGGQLAVVDPSTVARRVLAVCRLDHLVDRRGHASAG